MHRDLDAYKRLLIATYRQYLAADRALEFARDRMRGMFPPHLTPNRGVIGAPGSHIRRLHENRERALRRLQSAQRKLKAAEARLRRRTARPAEVLLLTLRVD